MNFDDPSGHGVISWLKKTYNSAKKKVVNAYNKAKTWVSKTYNKFVNRTPAKNNKQKNSSSSSSSTVRSSTRNTTYGGSSGGRGGRAGGSGSSGGYWYGGNSGGGYQRMSTAYDWAVYSGQSSYNWSGSRIKEAGNIRNSWTKILEKTVKKFCTTPEKLEKQMTKDSRARNLKQEMLRKSKELNKDKAWYKFLDKYGLAISGAVLGGMAVVIAGPVSAPVLAGGILAGGSMGGLIQEPNNKGHQLGLFLGTALMGVGYIHEAMKSTNVAVQTSGLAEKATWTANAGEAVGRGSNSQDIIQYEKLKSQYVADEIYNAERIGSALKDDPSHRAASYLSKEQLANGRTYSFTGGDGKSYTLLQTKGQLDGVDGIFEYITNDAGQVTHQRFIEGGRYTGFPNQVVPKGGY